jgi:glyoxylase-like metal-dependent hydrolase (beta-lactamase superfamily II)
MRNPNPIVAARIAVAAAVVALFALARVSAPRAAATPDAFARVVRPIADHVWLLERPVPTDAPFEGNVEVIEQSDGLVVIDAGGSPVAGRDIVRLIRRLSRRPVKAIVYTHYHGDHNLGAGELLAAWPGAQVISTSRTRANMVGPPMAYIRTYARSYADMAAYAAKQAALDSLPPALRGGWARFAQAGPAMVAGYTGLQAYPATLTFTDRLALPDTLAPLELMFLGRANTDGDAIAWLPKQRVIVTGDIVVHPIPYASACYLGEWIAVLRRLEAFDFRFLIPGHGAVQTDRDYLERLIAALSEVRSRVGPLARDGATLDEVRQKVDLSDLQDRFAGNDAWKRFVMRAVFLGDVVKNAWQEARGDSIVQGG